MPRCDHTGRPMSILGTRFLVTIVTKKCIFVCKRHHLNPSENIHDLLTHPFNLRNTLASGLRRDGNGLFLKILAASGMERNARGLHSNL